MDTMHAAIDTPSQELARGGPIQVFYSGDRTSLPTIDRAEGIYMWDTEGKRYLDASSGPVVTNIGHGNARVLDAMRAQAAKVCFASRAVFQNKPNIDLARRLVGLAGDGFDQAFIVSGGSEAVEAAIKLARQYAVASGQPARWKVLARNPGYHGSTLGAGAVTGDPESEAVFEAVSRVMPKVPAPFTYRLPDGETAESHAASCAEVLERTIVEEGSDSVLAFLMEPVGGLATGGLVAPDAYYGAVREICTRHGVLLIFDEVMSGAGRTGTFLAAEHWPEARPDIVTLAKGIAAGYTPLGVVLAPNAIVNAIVGSGGFLHGHTYSANPLSCAIADAVVAEMIDRDLMTNASRVGAHLRHGLERVAAGSRIIGDIRGKGLLLAAEIVADKGTKAMVPAAHRAVYRLLEIGIEEGLLLYTRKTAGGRFGEWVMITPPLILSVAQADELIGLFAASIARLELELDDADVLNAA